MCVVGQLRIDCNYDLSFARLSIDQSSTCMSIFCQALCVVCSYRATAYTAQFPGFITAQQIPGIHEHGTTETRHVGISTICLADPFEKCRFKNHNNPNKLKTVSEGEDSAFNYFTNPNAVYVVVALNSPDLLLLKREASPVHVDVRRPQCAFIEDCHQHSM